MREERKTANEKKLTGPACPATDCLSKVFRANGANGMDDEYWNNAVRCWTLATHLWKRKETQGLADLMDRCANLFKQWDAEA